MEKIVRVVRLAAEDDFEGWRSAARSAALAGIPAEHLHWQPGEATTDLFAAGINSAPLPPVTPAGDFAVPRRFIDVASDAILHVDPSRFAQLYALLLRLRDHPALMGDEADPSLRRISGMAAAVRRDIHKMRAFLRFREVIEADRTPRYIAWFEPEHHILRANAGFFVRRFATMRWSILTPRGSLHWDGATLHEGPGAHRSEAAGDDPVEVVWKSYYASIFNPARLKIGTMLKEMPRKYWKNMPETALIPSLIAGAEAREKNMVEAARIRPLGDGRAALEALREEALCCRRCPLWKPATQTVFGEGPADANLMLVGEQPGDQEDLVGHPFVGPAGKILDRALAEAGIDRATAYVTNAVKHFKFEPRGKRRLHAKPNNGEISACRWWLDQERSIVRPRFIMALGASAAQALLGRPVTITRSRGQPILLDDESEAWVTVHPSFLLRIPDETRRAEQYSRFVADLTALKDRITAL
jgi:DNA polymerase